MSDQNPRHSPPVLLTLESLDDPITGALLAPDGQHRRFQGWLELLALLDEAQTELEHSPPPEPPLP